MKKINFLLLIYFILLLPGFLFSQQDTAQKKGIITEIAVVDGDSIPYITLPYFVIIEKRIYISESDKINFDKLVRNVKKVYPYAKLAGIKLREYNDILKNAANDGERRRIMKKAEKEIKDQFGNELKNLTFSQGKILIKLLYRETGNSSYVLIQELRGKFVAFFYQAFARLFGYNLKITYDPLGEDRQIEYIINLIEKGLV